MNKIVLITGASKGIGRSTAIEFAKKGYNIILNYNNSIDEAKELKILLEEKYKIECLDIKADITIEEEIDNMINKAIEKFNHIDVLVNNAAIAIDTTFEDKTKENFQKILDTNLIGTFLVSKKVAKYMKEKEKGCIINISSTNYDASKAGVISLTKNLAVELAPNIRVNTVAPGWVNTEMSKDLSEEFRKEECNKILLNRFAEDYEIAKVIYFLSTEDASYINGSIIRVDGGKK